MTIGIATILAAGFSLLLCFAIPLGGLIYMQKKGWHIGRAFLVGMLTFTVSQMAIRIPLLMAVLPRMDWYLILSSNPYAHGVFLAITAGLFEETGRFLFIKGLLKKNRRYVDGIAFGLGHGGIEAMALTGLTMLNTLVVMVAINLGAFEQLAAGQPEAVVRTLLQQYLALGPLDLLLGGAERIFAITLHIGLSLVVLQGINKGRGLYYLVAAILIHGAVDFIAVVMTTAMHVSALAIEGVLLLVAAGFAVYIVKAAADFKKGGYWHEEK